MSYLDKQHLNTHYQEGDKVRIDSDLIELYKEHLNYPETKNLIPRGNTGIVNRIFVENGDSFAEVKISCKGEEYIQRKILIKNLEKIVEQEK
jgi:hypothetical protein